MRVSACACQRMCVFQRNYQIACVSVCVSRVCISVWMSQRLCVSVYVNVCVCVYVSAYVRQRICVSA